MKRILLLSCVIVTFGIILSLNREPVVAPIVEAPVEVPSTPDSSPIPVPPKPTYEDAIANARLIIGDWLETANRLGREIPKPKGKLMYA